MLRTVGSLKHLPISAVDGSIGRLEDVCFDDLHWTVRYVVVDTGGWLSGRQVLVTPISIHEVRWDARRIDVSLTREQVKNSPDIDTDQPVSRQHETKIYKYYGYPYYWTGPYLWGPTPVPRIAEGAPFQEGLRRERWLHEVQQRDDFDPHLRSAREVTGYRIEATDGTIGSIAELLYEDQTWAILYLVINPRKWLPSEHVLVPTERVTWVSWEERKVYVGLTREAVRSSPEYEPTITFGANHKRNVRPDPPRDAR